VFTFTPTLPFSYLKTYPKDNNSEKEFFKHHTKQKPNENLNRQQLKVVRIYDLLFSVDSQPQDDATYPKPVTAILTTCDPGSHTAPC